MHTAGIYNVMLIINVCVINNSVLIHKYFDCDILHRRVTDNTSMYVGQQYLWDFVRAVLKINIL